MPQNVTVSLPDDIIKDAKHLAVDQGISLSALVAQTIINLTKQGDDYSKAQKKTFELLESGYKMGSQGHLDRERDSLHER